MKDIEKKLYHFDSEVFAEDWLFAFNPHNKKNDWYVFHNDVEGLQNFIETHPDIILCGYNVKHYDYYILKGCLLGYDPFVIKEINDFIIKDGEQGWMYPFDYLSVQIPNMLDLMLDIVPMKSLKEIEGNLGLDITESTIDFDYAEKWDKAEFEEILAYCKEDIKALRPLYELRKSYIEAKLNLAEMCGMEREKCLSLTNAKLTAEFLKAKPYKFDENEAFEFPKNLDLECIPEDIKEFFMTMESKFLPDGTVNEEASSSYLVDIAECPHKLGFGGLHGALNNFEEESTDKRTILNYDVTSYYPSLMILYNYVSRSTEQPDLYEQAYKLRVEAKKNGDMATSDALKLVLNTAFGASNNKYNKLYDPLMAKSICVSGQCFLIDLILHLKKIPSLRLIQSNTDGIMFSVDKGNYDLVTYAIKKWERRTGFNMEEERIAKIWQRDVNNYVMLTERGKVKSKGGIFASYNNQTDKYRGNSMAIVGEAITELFVNGTPVEETITNCNDIEKFQIISKTGGSYQATIQEIKGGYEPVQKCNRLFASKHKSAKGIVKKVKLTKDKYVLTRKAKKISDKMLEKYGNLRFVGEENGKFVYESYYTPYPYKPLWFISRMDTVANCPKSCIISNNKKISIDKIDKSWYNEYTNKEILKMKGMN